MEKKTYVDFVGHSIFRSGVAAASVLGRSSDSTPTPRRSCIGTRAGYYDKYAELRVAKHVGRMIMIGLKHIGE